MITQIKFMTHTQNSEIIIIIIIIIIIVCTATTQTDFIRIIKHNDFSPFYYKYDNFNILKIINTEI